MKKYIILLITILLLSPLFPKVALAFDNKVSKTEFLFSTIVTIDIYDINPSRGKQLLEDCFKRMREFDKKYNPNDNNVIHNLNSLKSGEVKVLDKELYSILKEARRNYKLSNGYYDVTIGKLSQIYGFKGEHPSLPDEDKIKEALNCVGFENIVLSDDRKFYFKKNGVVIDIGGLAKGYIIDKTYEYLKSQNVKSAIINGGGDIKVIGKRGNRNFTIGVADPENPNMIMATINLKDGESVATSGDYERFFIHNGKRYCHIFNPKTGYPGNLNHASTVIADSSVKAEALSLSSFLMTKEIALKYIKKNGCMGMIVTDDYTPVMNLNFIRRCKLIPKISKKDNIFFVIIIIILILSFVFSMRLKGKILTEATITINGEIVKKIDLTKDNTYKFKVKLGEIEVEVKDGKIGIISSPCSKKICVEHGFTNIGGDTIVCLPNKFVINIENNKNEVDTVTR